MEIALATILFLFLVAGLCPIFLWRKQGQGTNVQSEYFLGGTSLSGLVAGLSSATTSNSAFMLVVMIPLIAGAGGSSAYWAWLLIGWTGGIACAWFFTYKRIKHLAENESPKSFIELLSNGLTGWVVIFKRSACILIILFLGVYASGQLIATHDTLAPIMGTSAWLFVLVAAVVVLLYSSIGGLRSTVYSDIAQAVVVLLGALFLFQALSGVNFPDKPFQQSLTLVGRTLKQELFSQPLLPTLLFITGWFFGGLFEVAQPHVMVRVMAIRKQGDARNPRNNEILIGGITYIVWFVTLSTMVISIGCLAANAASQNLISGLADASGDQYFGILVTTTLKPWQAGICIAGLLAASISTADAQILSASAAFSQDWSSHNKQDKTAL